MDRGNQLEVRCVSQKCGDIVVFGEKPVISRVDDGGIFEPWIIARADFPEMDVWIRDSHSLQIDEESTIDQ